MKCKVELDIDVLTASKDRIKECYKMTENVVVSFSGGKDSLTVLYLCKQVKEELGIKTPVKVFFYDEELIPDEVIDFVNEYRQKDWVDLTWLCAPLESNKKMVTGSTGYIQWDIRRANGRWIRPKPEWAYKINTVKSQFELGDIANEIYGKHIMLLGVRAAESLTRLKSIMASKSKTPYLMQGNKEIVCKPIYDWSEDDIFKFFYDNKIVYCNIYNRQLYADVRFRVATPLHSEGIDTLCKIREMNPKFFNDLCRCFPETHATALYINELSDGADGFDTVIKKYGKTTSGVLSYIKDTYVNENLNLAIKLLRKALLYRRSKTPTFENNFNCYPVPYIYHFFIKGTLKRGFSQCPFSNDKWRKLEVKDNYIDDLK